MLRLAALLADPAVCCTTAGTMHLLYAHPVSLFLVSHTYNTPTSNEQEVEKEVDEGEEGGGRRSGRKRKIEVLEYHYERDMEGGCPCCYFIVWRCGLLL